MAARLAALRERVRSKEESLAAKRMEHSTAAASQPEARPAAREQPREQARQLTPEQAAEAQEKARRRTELLQKLKAQDQLAEIVRRARPPAPLEEEEGEQPPAKRPCGEGREEEEPGFRAAEARCRCGRPPAEFTVRKEGPNQGRTFLKCAEERCQFWEWADGGRSQGMASTGGSTGGGGLSLPGTGNSTASPVLGLGFSGPLASALAAGSRAPGGEAPAAPTPPARPAARSRGFFEQTPPPPAAPAQGLRTCSCGEGAVSFKVNRDGPNQGRRFWKCGEQRCKFFEWDDEPSKPGPAPAPGVGGGGAAASCFRCGKPGHFSRDCESKPGAPPACFRCGEGGHFARDCPSLTPA